MYKAAIIGCGRPRSEEGATGFGMAHLHAEGYKASPDAEIVAAVDIAPENLASFCERHKIKGRYTDIDEMLRKERPDIVSVCLWPHLHAPVVIQIAQAGTGVKAIHCEKPMATTWGDARQLAAVCAANDVRLTFNHQRRFGPPFQKAKELLDSGVVGTLERVEAFTSNLYDWGTHWLDMMFYYNDECPADWVLGQIDARQGGGVFGVYLEGQGQSLFRWTNGVMGLLITGRKGFYDNALGMGCANRILGSNGTIEVGVNDGPLLRYRSDRTSGVWKEVEVSAGMHGDDHHKAAVLDLIEALKESREPMLAARKALQSTEIIFATYESSRRRGRIDLPLEITDSPFAAMLDDAVISPWENGFLEVNGVRLHYHRTGGDGPTLVLSHGFSDNGLCWTPLARALEGDYDLVLYDARSHGKSEARGGSSYDDRADDVAALIKELKLEKPVGIGHSMGASTVAQAAARHPGLFSALVLEDPPWSDTLFQSDEDVAARRERIVDLKSRNRSFLKGKARADHPDWPESALGPWAQAKNEVSVEVLEDSGPNRTPWREVAQAIDCPTLLVTGDSEQGAIVTDEVGAECASLNGLIRVHKIEASHNIRRDRFEEFTDVVREFLEKTR